MMDVDATLLPCLQLLRNYSLFHAPLPLWPHTESVVFAWVAPYLVNAHCEGFIDLNYRMYSMFDEANETAMFPVQGVQ